MIEHAVARPVSKPWGRSNLGLWNEFSVRGSQIGELLFERADVCAREPSLLLKLLFTSEPIQEHPNQADARLVGLGHGKLEAWYIVSANPDGLVAIGLNGELSAEKLRRSILDGSIVDQIRWRMVRKGDALSVPAGVIRAIGPSLVIAEVQQASDTMLSLPDHGPNHDLNPENVAASSFHGSRSDRTKVKAPTSARTLLAGSPSFIFERVTLAPGSLWTLDASQETWFLTLEGGAEVGPLETRLGGAIYLDRQQAQIIPQAAGLTALMAYSSPEVIDEMLTCDFNADDAEQGGRALEKMT